MEATVTKARCRAGLSPAERRIAWLLLTTAAPAPPPPPLPPGAPPSLASAGLLLQAPVHGDAVRLACDRAALERHGLRYRAALREVFGDLDPAPAALYSLPYLGPGTDKPPLALARGAADPPAAGAACDRIVCVLAQLHSLRYAPQLPGLVAGLLAALPEEHAFAAADGLLRATGRTGTLITSKRGEDALADALLALVRSLFPRLAAHMDALLGPGGSRALAAGMLRSLMAAWLPDPGACLTVLDAFLYEGPKALLRYALALLRHTKHSLKATTSAPAFVALLRSYVCGAPVPAGAGSGAGAGGAGTTLGGADSPAPPQHAQQQPHPAAASSAPSPPMRTFSFAELQHTAFTGFPRLSRDAINALIAAAVANSTAAASGGIHAGPSHPLPAGAAAVPAPGSHASLALNVATGGPFAPPPGGASGGSVHVGAAVVRGSPSTGLSVTRVITARGVRVALVAPTDGSHAPSAAPPTLALAGLALGEEDDDDSDDGAGDGASDGGRSDVTDGASSTGHAAAARARAQTEPASGLAGIAGEAATAGGVTHASRPPLAPAAVSAGGRPPAHPASAGAAGAAAAHSAALSAPAVVGGSGGADDEDTRCWHGVKVTGLGCRLMAPALISDSSSASASAGGGGTRRWPYDHVEAAPLKARQRRSEAGVASGAGLYRPDAPPAARGGTPPPPAAAADVTDAGAPARAATPPADRRAQQRGVGYSDEFGSEDDIDDADGAAAVIGTGGGGSRAPTPPAGATSPTSSTALAAATAPVSWSLAASPFTASLATMLPHRVAHQHLSLVYGTDVHGWGLHTAYGRCAGLAPLVAVLQFAVRQPTQPASAARARPVWGFYSTFGLPGPDTPNPSTGGSTGGGLAGGGRPRGGSYSSGTGLSVMAVSNTAGNTGTGWVGSAGDFLFQLQPATRYVGITPPPAPALVSGGSAAAHDTAPQRPVSLATAPAPAARTALHRSHFLLPARNMLVVGGDPARPGAAALRLSADLDSATASSALLADLGALPPTGGGFHDDDSATGGEVPVDLLSMEVYAFVDRSGAFLNDGNGIAAADSRAAHAKSMARYWALGGGAAAAGGPGLANGGSLSGAGE